jgi:hypothetical protein
MPLDLPFTNAAGAAESAGAAKPPQSPPRIAPAERTELPAAYRMHTAVDVEAEVAAFRDRE